MNSEPNWMQAAQQMQETLSAGFTQAMTSMGTASGAGMPQIDLAAFKPMTPMGQTQPTISFEPSKLMELQQRYIAGATALWNMGLQAGESAPAASDRRFADPAWQANPVSKFLASAYQLNANTLMGMVDAVDSDAKTKARLRFAVEQWMAASAPSNFLALNAEAQKKAIETKGESIAKGLANMLHDMKQGHVSMTDESVFEVGKNVATTEGAVVFENEFFQLLEYKALTGKVYEKPFLVVPPCINKFYILDLQPENSLIRYATSQGHRTFVISWCNPDKSMSGKTWDDYIEHAAIKAIDVVRDITGADTVNALGFCVGGTILGTALSVLAARGEKPVESVTLLTSMLDFSDTGILDIFIDEKSVKYREAEMGKGGLLKGKDLASTFSFLRPNDLVWNYVVGNYLKGETPPPFDLLYWNSDSTNLPGPFYAWYLRNCYFENNLVKPGKTVVCGEKIDLGRLDMPAYIYGSREDHIVPIEAAYASTQVLPGEKRFVMGASGHIAGVINPPAKKKRSYWVNDKLDAGGSFPATQQEWLNGAGEHPGSWWTDWSDWLKANAGKQIAAPKAYGSRKYKAIEPAPGRYVKVKA
ncbi:MAG: poly(R)-hydroxyalkanoic acid synthase, class [Polaromonas sp.]|nr:poly(R)-hydroxyalkanoic acid synthase, class [Polaromonas sp.]